MAFRFFRRVRIAPGLSLNFSKSGPSLSFGPRGAKITVGPRGVRRTVGIPGTGFYYTTTSGRRRRRRAGASQVRAVEPPVRPEDRLHLGLLKRLVTPKREEHLVDGLRAYLAGKKQQAYRHFAQGDDLADCAFLAGILALERKDLSAAEAHLKRAGAKARDLGRCLRKYGAAATTTLAITDEMSAVIKVDRRGVLLALIEVYQRQRRLREAVEYLRRLYRDDPRDLLVRLSLVELLTEEIRTPVACRQVVKLTAGVRNESPVHAGLLLYKGKALMRLGMHAAARDAFSAGLRRRSGRPEDLLLALRYERARAYEAMGQARRARREFERIYAERPTYEDVRRRIGA